MKTKKHPRPLASYIKPFIDFCEVERGHSEKTQESYKRKLELFGAWLRKSGSGQLAPHELTADHVWRYRLYLARSYRTSSGGRLSRKTQNAYLIALRVFLDFLTKRDVPSLPSSKVELAREKDEEAMAFLTADEIERLVAIPDTSTPTGMRDRAILELLFSTGMRIAELVALNADQFAMLKHGQPEQTYELSIVGKGKRVRTVFISPRAAHWLRAYLASRHDVHEPLFLNVRSRVPGSRRLSPRSIQDMVARCARLAGITKHVTPHTLRHSFATDLLTHGADLRSVQEFLGHKNVGTTQRYTQVTNKHLREVHERFHGGRTSDGI